MDGICSGYYFGSGSDIEIVSGTANGADKLGEKYAEEHGYTVKQFPADWDKHGKSAGYKRNTEMGDYCDMAVVFYDGQSKGSQHMIDIMRKLHKLCYVITK